MECLPPVIAEYFMYIKENYCFQRLCFLEMNYSDVNAFLCFTPSILKRGFYFTTNEKYTEHLQSTV